MRCKICGREIEGKFYLHLNSSHKMKKPVYLGLFPEQAEEYDALVPDVWNKGLTKSTDQRVFDAAVKTTAYCQQAEVRQRRSARLKSAYEKGDILDAETRRRVVEIGNKAWVDKIESSSPEERRKMLGAFTTAGNVAQAITRVDHTPEDYQRLYPWAKGAAKWSNCESCKKQIIIWVGGKPRPKKRFCDASCHADYQRLHPNYNFAECGRRYYSTKMNCEFFLRSSLELWLAEMLDASPNVWGWSACPLVIPYFYLDKKRKYYPDFLINGTHLVELKSGYFFNIAKEKTEAKLKAAYDYAESNKLQFYYFQFDKTNMSRIKFHQEAMVNDFLQSTIASQSQAVFADHHSH